MDRRYFFINFNLLKLLSQQAEVVGIVQYNVQATNTFGNANSMDTFTLKSVLRVMRNL